MQNILKTEVNIKQTSHLIIEHFFTVLKYPHTFLCDSVWCYFQAWKIHSNAGSSSLWFLSALHCFNWKQQEVKLCVNEVLEFSVKTALYSISIQRNTNVIIFRSVLPFLHIVMGKQTNKKSNFNEKSFWKEVRLFFFFLPICLIHDPGSH